MYLVPFSVRRELMVRVGEAGTHETGGVKRLGGDVESGM